MEGEKKNAVSSICYCRTSIFMSGCGSEGVDCNSDIDFDALFSALLELICLSNAVCQNIKQQCWSLFAQKRYT
jgi:hypothetical protein